MSRTKIRPFHRFDIRKNTIDVLFPHSPWLQNFHRTLLGNPQAMVDLIFEGITKDYYLGDTEEIRFGWRRKPVNEIPVGISLIRVRTGSRDCHLQFTISVDIDKNIQIVNMELNATENRSYVRLHFVEFDLECRPEFRASFYAINTVGFRSFCTPKEAGLLDYTRHQRLKRFTDLIGNYEHRASRALNDEFIAYSENEAFEFHSPSDHEELDIDVAVDQARKRLRTPSTAATATDTPPSTSSTAADTPPIFCATPADNPPNSYETPADNPPTESASVPVPVATRIEEHFDVGLDRPLSRAQIIRLREIFNSQEF
jgi:hypothetical protein